MMQQLPGPPGVFGSDDRNLAKNLFGPLAQVPEVANRSGDNVEISQGHVMELGGFGRRTEALAWEGLRGVRRRPFGQR